MKSELAVYAAFPVDEQNNFRRPLVDIDDGLLNEGADDAFTKSRIGIGPQLLQLCCHVDKLFARRHCDRHFVLLVLIDLLLHGSYVLKSLVPSTL